jgi:L-amino acid N-acyltransferase YncA
VADLSVRVATADDAAGCAAIYRPYVADTAVSFETEPPTPALMSERIAATLARFPWLVATREGDRCGSAASGMVGGAEGGIVGSAASGVVGYAYAAEHRHRPAYQWAAEVSVYVAAPARRSGIGRALYAELLSAVSRQGYRVALAGVTLPNPVSVALHEAMGFEPVGVYRGIGFKLGGWHDVGWWQLRLGTDRTVLSSPVPSVPVPFADLTW